MAAALSLTAGRGGGLIGNLSFGYLIDINCIVPIVVFSAFLFSKCHDMKDKPRFKMIPLFLKLIRNLCPELLVFSVPHSDKLI